MSLVQFIIPMFVALTSIGTASAAASNQETVLVEVFTTTDFTVQSEAATGKAEAHQNIDLQVYELDRIQLLETDLSQNLPADPEQAKQIALQRFNQLDKQINADLQNAAIGLAKAMQYGIDRYPAIIFNGEWVIYGINNLNVAFDHFLAWQAGEQP